MSLARRAARQSRREVRDARFAGKLGVASTRVPMVPGIQIRDPLPGMQAPVAASPSEGVIYSDGGMDRHTAAHESAHLLESRMTDADKLGFARAMGRPNDPWEVGTSGAMSAESTGYRRSLGEIFADYAAMVATRTDPEGNRVTAGYLDTADMPSRRGLLRFSRELGRFGKRNGLPAYARPRRPSAP